MSKAHAATAPLQSIEATVLDRDLAALPLEPWPAFPPEDILAGDPNTHRGTVLYRDPTQLYSIGVWCCGAVRRESSRLSTAGPSSPT